jgi:hypothetical protein
MARPKAAEKAARKLVRCLGPAKKEHFFCSPDVSRVRVCSRCRQLVERDNLGQAHFPVRVSP